VKAKINKPLVTLIITIESPSLETMTGSLIYFLTTLVYCFYCMTVPKLILFVDCSNFYHVLKDIGFIPAAVDCNKFFEKITKRKNPRVRFYDAPKIMGDSPRQYANQQHFHAELQKNPNLTLHFGRLQKNWDLSSTNITQVADDLNFCEQCKNKIVDLLKKLKLYKKYSEKGVDVRIAVDLIQVAQDKKENYDVAMLLSGDADLVSAVDFVVQKENKKVINAYFKINSGKELRDACTSCFMITSGLVKDCLK